MLERGSTFGMVLYSKHIWSMVERHAGAVEAAEKASDGCNLLPGSVIGRVAGVMILGVYSMSRSVRNVVHISRQKRFQRGDTFGGRKLFEMGDTFGIRADLRHSGQARF